MSYVLHILDNPTVATLEEAHIQIFEKNNEKGKRNPRFVAFAQALTAVYPDMDDGQDEDDVHYEESVWSDSPMDGGSGGNVYAIGIRTFAIDDRLFGFVADTAAEQGLQVCDMQAGRLYRTDRTVIHLDGTSTAFPAWSRTSLVRAPRKTALSPESVKPYVQRRLQAALAPHGWQLHQPARGDNWYFWREVGEIQQGLQFGERFRGETFDLSLHFLFSCERVTATLIDLFPAYEEVIRDVQNRLGLEGGDVSATAYELFGKESRAAFFVSPKSGEYASFSEGFQREMMKSSGCAEFATWQDIDLWVERFIRWFAAYAEPALFKVDSVPTLHRRIDTPERREEGMHRIWVARSMNFSLIAAYLANADDMDVWFDVAVSQLSRGGFRNGMYVAPSTPDVTAVLETLAPRVPGLLQHLSDLFVERYAALPATLQKALETRNENALVHYMSELKHTIGLSRAQSVHAQAQHLWDMRNRNEDYVSGMPELISALNSVLTTIRL